MAGRQRWLGLACPRRVAALELACEDGADCLMATAMAARLMSLELTKEEIETLIPSLRRYCREELDQELSDLRLKFLLDYIMEEIGPFAYNRGVRDAERYFRARVEDLPATCFEDGMTYWPKRKK
jgi:uncharacterized protein (DUF2164 family)